MQLRSNQSMKKGFTLIEILVVIGLSALLLGIVVSGQREFSRRKVAENEAVAVASKLRLIQTRSNAGVRHKADPDVALDLIKDADSDWRLDSYSVTFSSSGYTITADYVDIDPTNGFDPVKNKHVETSAFSPDVEVERIPSSPITFYSIGRGTNIPTSEIVSFCAFGYGQEVVIGSSGDITTREYDGCS